MGSPSSVSDMEADAAEDRKTTVITVSPGAYDDQLLDEPARAIRNGKLVGFPTETVYGIAANEQDSSAVNRLLDVKQNSRDKKLTIHIGSMDEFQNLSPNPPAMAARLAHRFWPGPLTMVLPHAERGTIGLRMPDHPVALDLLQKVRVPVVASSANLSGEDPALTAEAVLDDFEGVIEYVVDGGEVDHGTSSTVVQIDWDSWNILREGALSTERIQEEEGIQVLFVCTGNTCRSPMAEQLLEQLLDERGSQTDRDVTIRSAGIRATDGNRASQTAERVMQEEFGRTLSNHRTQQVTPEMIRESDHVYVMKPQHKKQLERELPELRGRIELLNSGKNGIDDPVGGTYDTYKNCALQIREALTSILPKR